MTSISSTSHIEHAGATTVWLARHGEVHNPREILYGRLPRRRLSTEGVRQAESLADFLAGRPLTAIYSSPMLRARTTAEIVATRHPLLQVRVTPHLHEVRTSWQGHTLADLDRINWDFYNHRTHPHDEHLDAIRDRMLRWVQRMLLSHQGQEVVGVSHGDPLLIILGHLRGLPMDVNKIRPATYIPTASLFRIRFDPGGQFQEAEMFVPHAEREAA